MPDYEELLRGSDHPRQLPPELRARLERALTAPAPLPQATRERLGARLARPAAGPGDRHRPEGRRSPKGSTQRLWARWYLPAGMPRGVAAAVAAAVGAAVVALAALGVTSLVRGGPGQPPPGPVAVPKASGARVATGAPAPRPRPAAQGPAVAGPVAPRPTGPVVVQPGAARPTGPAAANPVPSPVLGLVPSQRPVVASLEPRRGPASGGNWVEVTGSGLAKATAVRFGDVPAPRFEVVSGRRLRALAPAHAPGTVPVVVVTSAGPSAASPAGSYTFQ